MPAKSSYTRITFKMGSLVNNSSDSKPKHDLSKIDAGLEKAEKGLLCSQ